MIALAQALDCLPNLVSLSVADCAFQGGRNGPIRSHRDEDRPDLFHAVDFLMGWPGAWHLLPGAAHQVLATCRLVC